MHGRSDKNPWADSPNFENLACLGVRARRQRDNYSMRIRQFKCIGIIAFCAVTVLCVSLLARLNMTLAAICFLFILGASAVAYYRIGKKRSRFKAHSNIICQACKKQIPKARGADISRADAVFNRPVAAHPSNDKVDNATQSGEVISLLPDEAGYHNMTDIFVNSLPSHLQEMQEALDEGNLQSLALKLHALKELGSFTGFEVCTEKANALEQAVMDNEVDKVREKLDEMVRLCLKTKMTPR